MLIEHLFNIQCKLYGGRNCDYNQIDDDGLITANEFNQIKTTDQLLSCVPNPFGFIPFYDPFECSAAVAAAAAYSQKSHTDTTIICLDNNMKWLKNYENDGRGRRDMNSNDHDDVNSKYTISVSNDENKLNTLSSLYTLNIIWIITFSIVNSLLMFE
ncbi:unnamed protein product [Heterobilharzia americana]|nr:unnamed protein product [Heterobilharzia americana]